MNKRFCDRCGKEIPDVAGYFIAKHTHIVKLSPITDDDESITGALTSVIQSMVTTLIGNQERIEAEEIELCKKCAKDFGTWVNEYTSTECLAEEKSE